METFKAFVLFILIYFTLWEGGGGNISLDGCVNLCCRAVTLRSLIEYHYFDIETKMDKVLVSYFRNEPRKLLKLDSRGTL